MKKKYAIKAFLKNFLGDSSLELAKYLEDVSIFRKLEPKEILFFEGDSADVMYYLIDGSIKLYRISLEGKETTIRFVQKNELFAEIVITNSQKYPVNAQALSSSELLGINMAKVRNLAEQNSELIFKLLSSMTVRLKYLVDMVESLAIDNVAARLMNYMQQLSNKAHNGEFELPVAKGELALLLGTSAETVSRIFTKLKKDGLIKTNGKKIKLTPSPK